MSVIDWPSGARLTAGRPTKPAVGNRETNRRKKGVEAEY